MFSIRVNKAVRHCCAARRCQPNVPSLFISHPLKCITFTPYHTAHHSTITWGGKSTVAWKMDAGLTVVIVQCEAEYVPVFASWWALYRRSGMRVGEAQLIQYTEGRVLGITRRWCLPHSFHRPPSFLSFVERDKQVQRLPLQWHPGRPSGAVLRPSLTILQSCGGWSAEHWWPGYAISANVSSYIAIGIWNYCWRFFLHLFILLTVYPENGGSLLINNWFNIWWIYFFTNIWIHTTVGDNYFQKTNVCMFITWSM